MCFKHEHLARILRRPLPPPPLHIAVKFCNFLAWKVSEAFDVSGEKIHVVLCSIFHSQISIFFCIYRYPPPPPPPPLE